MSINTKLLKLSREVFWHSWVPLLSWYPLSGVEEDTTDPLSFSVSYRVFFLIKSFQLIYRARFHVSDTTQEVKV